MFISFALIYYTYVVVFLLIKNGGWTADGREHVDKMIQLKISLLKVTQSSKISIFRKNYTYFTRKKCDETFVDETLMDLECQPIF